MKILQYTKVTSELEEITKEICLTLQKLSSDIRLIPFLAFQK